MFNAEASDLSTFFKTTSFGPYDERTNPGCVWVPCSTLAYKRYSPGVKTCSTNNSLLLCSSFCKTFPSALARVK